MDRSKMSGEFPSPDRQEELAYTHNIYPPEYSGGINIGLNPERRPLTVSELERMTRMSSVQPSPGHTSAVRPSDMNNCDTTGKSLFGSTFFQTGVTQIPQEPLEKVGPQVRRNSGVSMASGATPSQSPGYMRYQGNQYYSHSPTHPAFSHGTRQPAPGNIPQQLWQQQGPQGDTISDSIAALLQSDLRLSPAGGIVKQHYIPLPKENVRLPKTFMVDGVVPVDMMHWKFFDENPDLWQLFHVEYESNIGNIMKKYIEWVKMTRLRMQAAQNMQIQQAQPRSEGQSGLSVDDEPRDEDESIKKRYTKQEREERWVDIMDHRHNGRKPVGSMSRLNDVLLSLAHDLSPIEEDRVAWKKAFEYTEDKVKKFFLNENVKVILFGSVANGLAVRSSNDIDVSVECQISDGEKGEEEKADLIESIGSILESDGVENLLILSHARVPVVKFVYPPTKTQVDITIKNSLACLNTRMIADYCAIDPRLAQLVHIVKHWAKKRNVNDPYKGTLSSYCYVLMCIFHLQTRSPPILPVLQSPEFPMTVSEQVGEWKVEYFDHISELKKYKFESDNSQSLAELVWEFFEFWAWKHNYLHDVVSIRLGKIISKESKDWTKRVGRDRHLLCVEDPFLLSHDLGRTVDMKSKDVMRKEFFRAATILRDFKIPENALFEPYTARQKKYVSHRYSPGSRT